jgi:fluoride exporter
MRPLIGIGFFGSYTTFSTMALDGIRLLDSGHAATGLTYWILTLIVGQMAGVYGMWLGRLEFSRRGGLDEARG